jgi:hypothetical protein
VEWYEKKIITFPVDYQLGKYSTKYFYLAPEEMKIFEHKKDRKSANIIEMLELIKEMKFKDKKYTKTLRKKLKKKKKEEVTNQEFINEVFMDVSTFSEILVNITYFSEYISDIGFKFNVDWVFGLNAKNLYIVIWSLNPPGNMYQASPSFEKIWLYTDVNLNSPLGLQQFIESFFVFKNVPVDFRAHMIIDIKSIKFRKNAATEITDYAWTIFPIFSTLELKDKKEDIVMYVRSGVFMIPLFSGAVRIDVVSKLKDQDDCWEFLLKENKRKVSSVHLLKNQGILIRWVDNQREGHFSTPMDVERIQYNFWGKDKEEFKLTEKTIKNYEKYQKVRNLLPSGKDENDMIDEINALLRSVYHIPI